MTPTYDNDDARWDAVVRRDRNADGAFFFAVRTTGVYCLPSCSGRPLRHNVRFFDTAQAAREAGFRACKRCRPDALREALAWSAGPCDLGWVLVAGGAAGLRAVLLGDDAANLARDLADRFPRARLTEDRPAMASALAAVQRRIAAPAAPADLVLDERGGALSQAVWRALRQIPAGETASYGQLARAVGRPRAARAVAQACAANPLAVLTPCHRAIRSDGGLSGYRWGAERKRALLEREAAA